MQHQTGSVRKNIQIAEHTFHLTLLMPNGFPNAQAGQFVMLRLSADTDALLGRPLAVYRKTSGTNGTLLEVVYLVVGKMTKRLAEVKPETELSVWGPLGNGFGDTGQYRHLICVAGGIGQTPFLSLAHQRSPETRQTLLYGVRSANRLACVDDFLAADVDVRPASDDGSVGFHGPVTELISSVYRPDEPTKLLCCGPKPMLRAAFQIAEKLQLPCDVSLETPMSCGMGICFGCVVDYRTDRVADCHTDDGEWDYRRTCVDGPVFDAYRLRWS